MDFVKFSVLDYAVDLKRSNPNLNEKGTSVFEIKHQRTFMYIYIFFLRELYYEARNMWVFCSEYVGTLLYFEKKATRMVKLLPPWLQIQGCRFFIWWALHLARVITLNLSWNAGWRKRKMNIVMIERSLAGCFVVCGFYSWKYFSATKTMASLYAEHQ